MAGDGRSRDVAEKSGDSEICERGQVKGNRVRPDRFARLDDERGRAVKRECLVRGGNDFAAAQIAGSKRDMGGSQRDGICSEGVREPHT